MYGIRRVGEKVVSKDFGLGIKEDAPVYNLKVHIYIFSFSQ